MLDNYNRFDFKLHSDLCSWQSSLNYPLRFLVLVKYDWGVILFRNSSCKISLTRKFEFATARVAVMFCTEVPNGIISQVGGSEYHIIRPAGVRKCKVSWMIKSIYYSQVSHKKLNNSIKKVNDVCETHLPLLTTLYNRWICQNLSNPCRDAHTKHTSFIIKNMN